MASIAFIQHRLSRTDGVSLEVDKWRAVLEAAGHRVHYLAGNEDVRGGEHLPELFPLHPVTNRILRNATRERVDYPDGHALLAEVRAHADLLKPGILKFLRDHQIDLVLPNNLCFALGQLCRRRFRHLPELLGRVGKPAHRGGLCPAPGRALRVSGLRVGSPAR